MQLRVYTDLAGARVFYDDASPLAVSNGQAARELTVGDHTLRIVAGMSEAVMEVHAEPALQPTVNVPMRARASLLTVIAHADGKARITTATGPVKLTINGKPTPTATSIGVDIPTFPDGAVEITTGEGVEKRYLNAEYGRAPGLTIFLKSELKQGTIELTSNVDGATVFFNGKPTPTIIAQGKGRISAVGTASIQLKKSGFGDSPVQTVSLARGAEAHLHFTLNAVPKFASLVITGGTPGTEVFVAQQSIGVIAGDGALRNNSIAPGNHAIELRRDQFEPRRMNRAFKVGETVSLTANDATLTRIPVATPPPPPPPAPPPTPKAEPPSPPKPAPPKIRSGDLSNFDTPSAWSVGSDGVWKHRGQAALTYSIAPNGIFTFSIYMLRSGGILRGGRVRWAMNYVDARNYTLYELDEEHFWAKVVENGKTLERKKVSHKLDKSMRVWNIQIDASASRLVHKVQGDNGWLTLDTWSEPGRDFTQGKFAVLVNGNDEVGLSNFQFTGRR
jgi:hypothetical protein